jgi:hypothetical protein
MPYFPGFFIFRPAFRLTFVRIVILLPTSSNNRLILRCNFIQICFLDTCPN